MTQGCLRCDRKKLRDPLPQRVRRNRLPLILLAVVLTGTLAAPVSWGQTEPVRREQIVPILAATTGEHATGTVAHVVVAFEERADRSGLKLHFRTTPGRFSRLARAAIQQAVLHAARSLDLSPDSWTVALTVPYPDVTIGGDSLSGMIALTVAALAQGHPVPSHTVLTGTITPDGFIAPVGAVPLKLAAASKAKIRRVLVSDQQMGRGGHVGMFSTTQISPVRSVREALDTIMMKTSSTP